MKARSDRVYWEIFGKQNSIFMLEECYITSRSEDYCFFEEWGCFSDHGSAVDAMRNISQLHTRQGDLECEFTLSYSIAEIKIGRIGTSKYGARWHYRGGQALFFPDGWFDAPYVPVRGEGHAFRSGDRVCFCHEKKLHHGLIAEVPPDESQLQEWPLEARTNLTLNRFIVEAPGIGAVELLEYELIRRAALPEWARY